MEINACKQHWQLAHSSWHWADPPTTVCGQVTAKSPRGQGAPPLQLEWSPIYCSVCQRGRSHVVDAPARWTSRPVLSGQKQQLANSGTNKGHHQPPRRPMRRGWLLASPDLTLGASVAEHGPGPTKRGTVRGAKRGLEDAAEAVAIGRRAESRVRMARRQWHSYTHRDHRATCPVLCAA